MNKENGSLDICIAKNPAASDWGVGDYYSGMQLHPDEWEALFLGVFGVEEAVDYESSSFEEQEEAFQTFVAGQGFPMLSRIWHIYQDAYFLADEVDQLHGECVRLEAKTDDPIALKGLDKIKRGCMQAVNALSGVAFVSD